jgi:hypothetical protein
LVEGFHDCLECQFPADSPRSPLNASTVNYKFFSKKSCLNNHLLHDLAIKKATFVFLMLLWHTFYKCTTACLVHFCACLWFVIRKKSMNAPYMRVTTWTL